MNVRPRVYAIINSKIDSLSTLTIVSFQNSLADNWQHKTGLRCDNARNRSSAFLLWWINCQTQTVTLETDLHLSGQSHGSLLTANSLLTPYLQSSAKCLDSKYSVFLNDSTQWASVNFSQKDKTLKEGNNTDGTTQHTANWQTICASTF